MEALRPAKRIVVLAYPGCLGAELFAFCDALLIANHVSRAGRGRQPIFDVRVAGVSGRSIMAAGGVRIGLNRPHRRPDLLVVPGFDFRSMGALHPSLKALGRQAGFVSAAFRRGIPVASICVGAFLLGEAGVLDGRRVTTAWMFAPELVRRYPAAVLQPQAMLVEDGGIITTGAFAAFDLAIHLIRRTAGDKLAQAIGRMALLDTQRTSQAPFVDADMLEQSNGAFSDAVAQWLQRRLSEPYRLDRLARAFSVSSRTLLRRFKAESGESPLACLQRARIETAKKLLASTALTVSAITERIGYQNVSTFSRLFGCHVGDSPAKYRQRFTTRRGPAARTRRA